MRFLKGHGRKGTHNTAQHNAAIGKANAGRIPSQQTRIKMHDAQIGKKRTEAQRQRFSRIAREKGFGKWMTGRHPSPASVEKGKLARIGHAVSEVTRQKISIANSGDKNGMFGKAPTAATRQKLREASLKTWSNAAWRKKYIANIDKDRMREMALRVVMPKQDTAIEKTMQRLLDCIGVVFKKHKVIGNIQHKYHCDLFVPSRNLIIECDGDYWHHYPTGRELDLVRTREILSAGYTIVRFWEKEIKHLAPAELFRIVMSGQNRINFSNFATEVTA